MPVIQEIRDLVAFIQHENIELEDISRNNNINLARDRESSMDSGLSGRASAVFTSRIREMYQARFNRYGNTDLERINAIFREIKRLILNTIINDSDVTNSPQSIKVWLREHIEILVDETHPRHRSVLLQSRNYLNNNSANQAAWRNFDPASHNYHPRLEDSLGGAGPFIDDSSNGNYNGSLRERLAYYYLIITDSEHPDITQEDRDFMVANFISTLSDIRRAHSNDYHTELDAESCIPGIWGRIAMMGNRHPVADVSNSNDDRLNRSINSFVTRRLTARFRSLSTTEKQRYLDSINGLQSIYFNDLLSGEDDYDQDLYGSLLEVFSTVGIELFSFGGVRSYNLRREVVEEIAREAYGGISFLHLGSNNIGSNNNILQLTRKIRSKLLSLADNFPNIIHRVFIEGNQEQQPQQAQASRTPRIAIDDQAFADYLEQEMVPYFTDSISGDPIVNPVYFLGVDNDAIYDEGSVRELFDRTRATFENIDRLRNFVNTYVRENPDILREFNLGTALIDLPENLRELVQDHGGEQVSVGDELFSLNACYAAISNLEGSVRGLTPGQARSPLSRAIINEADMQSARLFRDVVHELVPDEFRQNIFANIGRGTNEGLHSFIRSINSGSDVSGLISNDHLALLNRWGLRSNRSEAAVEQQQEPQQQLVQQEPAAAAPAPIPMQLDNAAIMAVTQLAMGRRQEGIGGEIFGQRNRYTLNTDNTNYNGPYSDTIDFPRNVPVVHPYNPIDGSNPNYDAGVPFFPVVATLPNNDVGLPESVRQLLVQHNINLANLTINFCAQTAPWVNNHPVLLRPHAWIHPNAPVNGIYNRNNNLLVGITGVNSRFNPLVNLPVSTHGEGAQVVYSPNNMVVQGIGNIENNSHRFYSFCFEPNSGRAVVTLHWLLTQDSYNDLLQNIAIANPVTLDTVTILEPVLTFNDQLPGSSVQSLISGNPMDLGNNAQQAYRLIEQPVVATNNNDAVAVAAQERQRRAREEGEALRLQQQSESGNVVHSLEQERARRRAADREGQENQEREQASLVSPARRTLALLRRRRALE